MPIYPETIIKRWFGKEKNLKILNGIVHHKNDKQIAKETKLRIDRVANYRRKLKKKGLLTTGFYNINHEKLGLVQEMDFPREKPDIDDTFLTFLVRISRPFGYLRLRQLPPDRAGDGYHLGVGKRMMNSFSLPFIVKDFMTRFEEIFGQVELDIDEERHEKDEQIDLLSIYICKEVQRGNYGARTIARAISKEIDEDELGIQPSISNVNRRLKRLRREGIIRKSNPLNLVPLRPYYNFDSAIVKKTKDFNHTLAALTELNVIIGISNILNKPEKAYIVVEYHFSQKWDILRILKEYLEEITFLDHAPFGLRRTLPYEYFRDMLSEKKHI
jgi:DNA-binding Lrp family transcriptional regulator